MNSDMEYRKQKRLERLGTNNPVCKCGEADWRCLTKIEDRQGNSVILCRNCNAKPATKEAKRKPVNLTKCALCPENNPCCLEKHHIAGRVHDNACITLCLNCHDKLSDGQKSHPNIKGKIPTEFEKIVHFLWGLADLLALLREKIFEFIHHLCMEKK